MLPSDLPHTPTAAPARPSTPRQLPLGLHQDTGRERARGAYFQLGMKIHLRGTCSAINSLAITPPEDLERVAGVCLCCKAEKRWEENSSRAFYPDSAPTPGAHTFPVPQAPCQSCGTASSMPPAAAISAPRLPKRPPQHPNTYLQMQTHISTDNPQRGSSCG